MSISRVNVVGWSANAKLTSSEANGLDLNTTYALDKRSGQTDTLESDVACSGAGRVRRSYVAGADANTTYVLSGGNAIIDARGALTAAREYTLSNTGASAGDERTIQGDSTYAVTVKNHGGTTIITLKPSAIDSTSAPWADFIYDGSNWVLFRSVGGIVTATDTQTLTNKTLTSPTVTGTAVFSGTNGSISSVPGSVQTSSTTEATVASYSMSDETLCLFDYAVTCARRTNVTKGGSYKGSVTYRRTGAAAPVIVGSAIYLTDQETTAGDSVVFDVDGNDVRVRVTAGDADPRNWLCELRVQETTNG